ncbi:MAG: hypothetical protein ABFD54_11415 [Armatimonadota bacterium]
MPRHIYTKEDPPTGYKAISGDTGETPDTAVEVPFGITSECLHIENTGSVDISISLDGGETYFTLSAEQTVDIDVMRTSMYVQSSGTSVPFIVLVGGGL